MARAHGGAPLIASAVRRQKGEGDMRQIRSLVLGLALLGAACSEDARRRVTEPVRTAAVGGSMAAGMAGPDGGTGGVAGTDGNVYAINAVTDSRIAALALAGDFTKALAFHPDGGRLYASQLSGGTVKVIDTRAN